MTKERTPATTAQDRATDGHRERALSAKWLLQLFVVGIVVSRCAFATAENPTEPVGVLRSVEGTAYIVSTTGRRPAEPLIAVTAGDTIIVESGKVVVVDVRSGDQHELAAGRKFVFPQSVPNPEPSLWPRISAALAKIRREPDHTVLGAARPGPSMRMWPDDVRFAPNAYVKFQWEGKVLVKIFRLFGPQGEGSPTRYQLKDPPNSVTWPKEIPRRAGRYTWEVRGSEGRPIGSREFEILSDTETAAKHAYYMRKAKPFFPAKQQELGAELLAAGDGYFLQ